jgi:hypothetical protein
LVKANLALKDKANADGVAKTDKDNAVLVNTLDTARKALAYGPKRTAIAKGD